MNEIFLSHNSDQVPNFVAHDLAQLPPYDVSSMDVLYLRRQIITMKRDISNLVCNQRSLFGVVQTNATKPELMNYTSVPVADISSTPNILSNTELMNTTSVVVKNIPYTPYTLSNTAQYCV